MFSFAIATIAEATSRPRRGRGARRAGRARARELRRRAAAARRGRSPGSSRPSTTFASVSVASSRRGRSRRGPGSAPALCGPTWRNPPGSTQPIEPPPAPIVFVLTLGTLHRQAELDLVVRRVERLAADDQADVAARAAHVEHDPLLGAGARARRSAPPIAPPAMPESSRCAGRSRASRRERVAAVRLEQRPRRRAIALLVERRRDAGDVVVEQRLQVRVDDRGRAPLVLAPDRRDLVRERDRELGEPLGAAARASRARAPG